MTLCELTLQVQVPSTLVKGTSTSTWGSSTSRSASIQGSSNMQLVANGIRVQ